jgi:hypothetical protein
MAKPEPDSPWVRRYATQRHAVTSQLERVSRALEDRGQTAILKETAILEALSMDACSALAMAAAERIETSLAQSTATSVELADKIAGLAGLMASSEQDLAQHLQAFTASTDASAMELARWTRVMAWATIALAVLAIMLVAIAAIGLFRIP